jgi:ABC-2 type transport system permease protein
MIDSSSATTTPAASHVRAPSPQKTLHRLFLTLFLRGRTSRGLEHKKAPRSMGQKLALTLGLYALVGLVAITFGRLPIFALSVYLHSTTFAFLGMFLASSAGEVLFNKEEADILLHRPVSPQVLLWTRIRVLVEAALWISGAFNLVGFFVGWLSADGGWRFVVAHALSTSMEALFCAGCVVMVYQLCLRWFGRERLEGLITTAQVILSVGVVVGSQILPQFLFRNNAFTAVHIQSWWIVLLPPAWFAGFDDLIGARPERHSWLLALLAVISTVVVTWIAFARLAGDYATGLQRLSETTQPRAGTAVRRRWIDLALRTPPLRWWLRDPVARASFLLTVAYLVRDRDVKLRIYPSIAPLLVLPVVFLFRHQGRESGGMGGFEVALAASYLSVIPMMVLAQLQFSQQWQATDVFRAAPLRGPASICHGARQAILFFLALPLVLAFGLIIWIAQRDVSQLLLLLPGAVAMPVFSLVPGLLGHGVPLSRPTEEAKGAARGLSMVAAMMVAFAISGAAMFSWWTGWFYWFLGAETVFAIGVYAALRLVIAGMRWPASE